MQTGDLNHDGAADFLIADGRALRSLSFFLSGVEAVQTRDSGASFLAPIIDSSSNNLDVILANTCAVYVSPDYIYVSQDGQEQVDVGTSSPSCLWGASTGSAGVSLGLAEGSPSRQIGQGAGSTTVTVTSNPAGPQPQGALFLSGKIIPVVNTASNNSFFISGQVVTALSGFSLSGVSLTLNTGQKIRTGNDGSYSFTGLSSGTYTVKPSYQNHTFSPSSIAIPSIPQSGQNFSASPVAGVTYTTSGQVTPASGPLSGVIVSSGTGLTATTDVSGNYSLTGLVPGSYEVSAAFHGYSFVPDGTQVQIVNSDRSPIFFSGTTDPAAILSITASPTTGGTVQPPTGGAFLTGNTVNITASPNYGWTSSGWSRPAADVTSPSTTVTMLSSESVTANFVNQEFSDVIPTDYFFDAVNLLGLRAITHGRGSGNFLPRYPCDQSGNGDFCGPLRIRW